MKVYLLTNTVNGKRYVGQTCVDPVIRFAEHCKASRYTSSRRRYIIARAIHKHGWGSFDAEIIDAASSQEELDRKEREWIAHYDCLAPNGYNADLGGRGKGRVSDSTKGKIGAAHRGKILSEETRAKISASRTGLCRKPKSEEHRRKIGLGNAGDQSSSAKLTWDLVRQMRSEYAAGGIFQRELAAKYGVTQGVVSLIVRNLTWVEEPPIA